MLNISALAAHYRASLAEGQYTDAREGVERVVAQFNGEKPVNVANPEVLEE